MSRRNLAYTAPQSERRTEIWEYRKSGLSVRAIAEKMKMSSATVYKDIRATLDELKELRLTDMDQWRDLELERLDDIVSKAYSVYARTQEDSIRLGALDRLLKASQERRKLLGLDAPAKTEISGPDGQPLFGAFTQFMMVAAQAGYKPEELLKMLVAEIDPTGPGLVIETVAKETE